MTTPISEPTWKRLRAELDERARILGFAALKVAAAEVPLDRRHAYRRFVEERRHAGMDWLAREPERRETPRGMWRDARSALILGMNYGPGHDPLPGLARKDRAYVSVYARNRDYHDVIKGRLKDLAGLLHRRTNAEVKVFVDTAPLLEKPLAEAAGLGWQGKHTNLVSREHGSWLFLGTILSAAVLPPDPPETDHCGRCRRCLDVCPTDAFPTPYTLDARRCLAYLLVEHEGPIPDEFRAAIGNRVFGCDDCLAVCPWNKFAQATREAKLRAREDLTAPRLRDLAALDGAGFRARFAGSPIKRLGHARFLRNVMLAIGNSEDPGLLDAAAARESHPDPVVAEAAAWAVGRLRACAGADAAASSPA